MSAEFIKTISELNERRFSRTLQRLIADKVPCGIFFAPDVPADARQSVNSFKRKGLNVNCVCVLFEEHKKLFRPDEGETLVAVKEFPNLPVKPKFIFNLGKFFAQMFTDYFGRNGTDLMTSYDEKASEELCRVYMKHLPELYAVHEMFAEDESKKVFRAAITGKLTNVIKDFRYAPEPQYFLNGFLPVEGDIAIDGGAYDGSTAADFALNGAKVFAFEMDADNYKRCLARVGQNPIVTVENLGLSDRESDDFYLPAEYGSHKLSDQTHGGTVGHFIDIDTYVARKNLPRVDYIKFDIEGAELEALHGAAKTITRHKPKMAISAYHKPEDLWTLATYIKSLRPDYEFKFRHYRVDCSNYVLTDKARAILRTFGLNYFCPTAAEMVLYCR